jgi:branched-chain amino acid transport system permease protein
VTAPTSAPAAWRRLRVDPVPLLAVGALCLVTIFSKDNSIQNTITLAMVWAFWALSLNVIWGYAGQFSMAQVALGGFTAYTFSLLAVKTGMNQLLAIVIATAATVLVSIIVGLVCLRLEDFRFAIMTLAFALSGVGLATGLVITGQSAGLNVPGEWAVLHLGPIRWDFSSRLGGFSALMMVTFFVLLIGIHLLLQMRPGRGMLAIREDAVLAESLGIAAGFHRILAFGVSAVVSSLAGVFQAEYYTFIFPELFSFGTLVNVIVVLTLGGRGRLYGPLVGGVLYASLTNILNIGGRYQASVFGIMVIVITILARHGLSYYLSQGEKGLVALVVDPAARARLRQALTERRWRRGRSTPVVIVTAAEEAVEESPEAVDPAAGSVAALAPDEVEELRRARVVHAAALRDAPALLEGIGLTKRFGGVTAVRDFSFTVHDGEILGLIGPNGAGKTTAFNLVSGFTRPDTGSLKWRGEVITGMSPHGRARRGLVRTFQQPRVFPALTVRENLVIAAQSHTGRVARSGGSGSTPGINEVLDSFGISDVADIETEKLSYGYSKRLGVAMAVATGSDLLMLDEPAAGLNGADVGHLRDDLVRLRDQGRTVWIVEHHMELVMAVCDRVIVLDAGAIIAVGHPEEIMADPLVIEAYLGGVA